LIILFIRDFAEEEFPVAIVLIDLAKLINIILKQTVGQKADYVKQFVLIGHFFHRISFMELFEI
jgi:hypothetical protein